MMELSQEKSIYSFINNSEYVDNIKNQNQNEIIFLLASQDDDFIQYLMGDENSIKSNSIVQRGYQYYSSSFTNNLKVITSSIIPQMVEFGQENLRHLLFFDLFYKILDNLQKTKFLVVFSSDIKEKYYLQVYKTIFEFLFMLHELDSQFLDNVVFAIEYNIEELDDKIIQNDIKQTLNLITASFLISNWDPKLIEFIKNLFYRIPLKFQTVFFSMKKHYDQQKIEKQNIINSINHLKGIKNQSIKTEDAQRYFNHIEIILHEELKLFADKLNNDITFQRYEEIIRKILSLKRMNEAYQINQVQSFYNLLITQIKNKQLYDDLKNLLQKQCYQLNQKQFFIILNQLQSAYEHLKLIDVLKVSDYSLYTEAKESMNQIFWLRQVSNIPVQHNCKLVNLFIYRINLILIKSYQTHLECLQQKIQKQEIGNDQDQIDLMVYTINYYLLQNQIIDWVKNEKLSLQLYFNEDFYKNLLDNLKKIYLVDQKNKNIKQMFSILSFLKEFVKVLVKLELEIKENSAKLKWLEMPQWCSKNQISTIKEELKFKLNNKIISISNAIEKLDYQKNKKNQNWIIQEIKLAAEIPKEQIQRISENLPEISQNWKNNMSKYIIEKLVVQLNDIFNNLEYKFSDNLALITDIMEEINTIREELQLESDNEATYKLISNLKTPLSHFKRVFIIIQMNSECMDQKYLEFIVKYESLLRFQYIQYFPELQNSYLDFKKQFNLILEEKFSYQQLFFHKLTFKIEEKFIKNNNLNYYKKVEKLQLLASQFKQRLQKIKEYESSYYQIYLHQNNKLHLLIECDQRYQITSQTIQKKLIKNLEQGNYESCLVFTILFSEIISEYNSLEIDLINEVLRKLIDYFPKQNDLKSVNHKTDNHNIEFKNLSCFSQYQQIYQISQIFEKIYVLICKYQIDSQQFINSNESIKMFKLNKLITIKESIHQLIDLTVKDKAEALILNSKLISHLQQGDFLLAQKQLMQIYNRVNKNPKKNINRIDRIRIQNLFKKEFNIEVAANEEKCTSKFFNVYILISLILLVYILERQFILIQNHIQD